MELPGGAAFILTLPLTVATVRALKVIVAGHVFTIETTSIHSVFSVSADDLTLEGFVRTSAGTLPAIDLGYFLGLAREKPPASMHAVEIRANGRKVAVLVDDIAGEQELLARSLGPRLERIRCYCGGMVLPDGQIALLLNTVALVEAAAHQSSQEMPEVDAIVPDKVPKILIVDDSKAVRTLVKLLVEKAGYEVVTAGDGAEAWQHLLEQSGASIVVADVDMPRMSGLELTKKIRESERFADLPVVLITGRETQEDKLKGLRAGATAYLSKERFDAEEFLETLRRII